MYMNCANKITSNNGLYMEKVIGGNNLNQPETGIYNSKSILSIQFWSSMSLNKILSFHEKYDEI